MGTKQGHRTTTLLQSREPKRHSFSHFSRQENFVAVVSCLCVLFLFLFLFLVNGGMERFDGGRLSFVSTMSLKDGENWSGVGSEKKERERVREREKEIK